MMRFYFSSVLFFQDLEAIRELIRNTWSEHRAGAQNFLLLRD